MAVFPSFKRLNSIPMYVQATFSLSTYGHLGCFLMLAIINNAVMNMGVHISLSDPDFNFLDTNLEVGFLDHIVVLFLFL